MNADLPLPHGIAPSPFPTLLRRVAAAVAAAAARVGKVRHQVLGADELRAMGDRELRDLGIGRSEIPHLLGRDRP